MTTIGTRKTRKRLFTGHLPFRQRHRVGGIVGDRRLLALVGNLVAATSVSWAVAGMVAFVDEARAGAPPELGKQASEKFALLGYAAGVVNALANSNLDVKVAFASYLRALLDRIRRHLAP